MFKKKKHFNKMKPKKVIMEAGQKKVETKRFHIFLSFWTPMTLKLNM